MQNQAEVVFFTSFYDSSAEGKRRNHVHSMSIVKTHRSKASNHMRDDSPIGDLKKRAFINHPLI